MNAVQNNPSVGSISVSHQHPPSNSTISSVTAGIVKLTSVSWSFLSCLTHNLSKLSEQSNIMAFYVDQLAGLGCREQKIGGAYKRSTAALNNLKILNEGWKLLMNA